MTLGQFFDWVQMNPGCVSAYFILIPCLAFLAGIFSKNEGHLSPWNYFYSILIYLVCIPGIFAVTFDIYTFFWERRSIMDTELLLQALPIVSMIATLIIIKNNVDLDFIPGFDKLSGFMVIIGVILSLMWFLDRTHIYVFSIIPFYVVIMMIIGGILLVRFSLNKLLR
ncbi:MAG: hypothetical protein M3Q56_13155 [Bacteroidota bacterium]|nr:hypothetical protein [Bacteroidota bacterium]